MANEHECVVCGIPRFLIEGKEYSISPLVCSAGCWMRSSHGGGVDLSGCMRGRSEEGPDGASVWFLSPPRDEG